MTGNWLIFFGSCNVILTGSFVAFGKDYIKGTKQLLTIEYLLGRLILEIFVRN